MSLPRSVSSRAACRSKSGTHSEGCEWKCQKSDNLIRPQRCAYDTRTAPRRIREPYMKLSLFFGQLAFDTHQRPVITKLRSAILETPEVTGEERNRRPYYPPCRGEKSVFSRRMGWKKKNFPCILPPFGCGNTLDTLLENDHEMVDVVSRPGGLVGVLRPASVQLRIENTGENRLCVRPRIKERRFDEMIPPKDLARRRSRAGFLFSSDTLLASTVRRVAFRDLSFPDVTHTAAPRAFPISFR